MTAAAPQRPPKPSINEVEDEDVTDESFESDDDADEDGPAMLAEETGIDLTDASELDADNVPADEEHDRVLQAPD
jgi:hypothetical protein